MRIPRFAVLLVVLALAACTEAPKPAAPAPASAGPTPGPAQTNAGSGDPSLDRFVAAVQNQLPDVAMDRRDEEVALLGQATCEGLAAGDEPAVIARDLAEQGMTTEQAGALVALAKTTACQA